MKEKQLPESSYPVPNSLQSAHCVYKGARFDVCTLELNTKSGQTKQRDAVIHPGAVVILPMLDDETILMIRNYRFAVGEELWELPAGTLEPDEAPIVTAARELLEETGYQAASVIPLLHFYSTPGFCTEILHVFLAKDLTFVGQNLEDTEEITVHPLKRDVLTQMVKDNTIKDAKTMLTLLYAL